jgi:hypothetical protein
MKPERQGAGYGRQSSPHRGSGERLKGKKKMAYWLDLFTPETWQAFQNHGATISGFRYRQRRVAREEIKPGDIFLCYLVRLSRWCGALRITSEAFEGTDPIFGDPDPFTIRFKVEPLVILSPENSIPIFENEIWDRLSVTKDIKKGSLGWAKYFRGSLRKISEQDGRFLHQLLEAQYREKKDFPLTDRDKLQLNRNRIVRTIDGVVKVSIPDADSEDHADLNADFVPDDSLRESIKVQAKLVEIGISMGFKIWVPRADKAKITTLLDSRTHVEFLDQLPLNYNEATIETIEQIDVIWLKRRAIVRAFEVEHTTAIYSGLLRMADLLAMQPNMDIRLHIVAPIERREKVFRELRRPVFALLDKTPLYKKCTYLSYDSVNEISDMEHLAHTTDSILEEYEEEAEE